MTQRRLRRRQRIGKYRVEERIGGGTYATVYRAMDTIEGIRVALKIPNTDASTEEAIRAFRAEIRLVAGIDHPHILPIKDASVIDGRLVIAMPLGDESLEQRLKRRISVDRSLTLIEHLASGLAEAHAHRVIHCDIKPENLILFPGPVLRIADFGIAKIARGELRGGGTGTVGYMAPEQAMGRPSLKSDVFSAGLVAYRLLSGAWPQWPYEWPYPGLTRVRERVPPSMVEWLRRATDPKPRGRFKDAEQMLTSLERLEPQVRRFRRARRVR